MNYSYEVENLLRNCGWYPGRSVDIAQYLEYYSKEDIEVNEVIQEFLKEFGGLKLIFPHHKCIDLTNDMDFNPLDSSPYRKETREYYKERTNEYLVPIGNTMGKHMYVYMSFSGSIYITDSDYMYKFGKNYFESLEIICQGKMGEEIEDIYDEDDE